MVETIRDAPTVKVLVIGGYGTFGSRLIRLLANRPGLRLVVAGRSLSKSRDFCRVIGIENVVPARFDREGDLKGQLSEIEPDLVVDASGPFQTYGAEPYGVAEAAVASGADYIDLADGVEFVDGIRALDARAREAGRFALSGASSFPALSSSVVRKLATGLDDVVEISAGVAPSPRAGFGLSVIRSVLGYAGKPVKIVHEGHVVAGRGLLDSRYYTITLPGGLPLFRRRFSLVEVPDLKVLARKYPSAKEIWFGVAPLPALLLRLLNLASWLVHIGVLPSLSPFALPVCRVINSARWGEHRGGMFITVSGRRANGQSRTRRWHMVAEGDDGPFIPSMAAAIIISKLCAGERPKAGARPCSDEIGLADFSKEFARRRIRHEILEDASLAGPVELYRRILGPAWKRLPEPIRFLHDLRDHKRFRGLADVDRGTNMASRIVGWSMGFPAAGRGIPVTVDLCASGGKETWVRTFAERSFKSTQEEGSGLFEGLVVERFGPMAFGLALVQEEGKLNLLLRRWSAFGLPMPLLLAPRNTAFEHEENGRFNFSVSLALPVFGLLVWYRGWLEPEILPDSTQFHS